MFPKFAGRAQELALLDRLHGSAKAELLVLYGRRRVGKTRLLTHWREQNRAVLYWVASPGAAADQLRSFSQAVYDFQHPNTPAPANFSYGTWQQVWEVLAETSKDWERFTVFIDEFTYLMEANPSIAGSLQNGWDHVLSRANLFLAITGSHFGMMQRSLLAYQAPLYGRASAQLKLEPLSFGIMSEFFPKYRADERVALYAIFGGIPAYWQRVDPSISVSENIRNQLLTPGSLMHDEPRLLLNDFVSDLHNYVGLLAGIASGARTNGELSKRTGLAPGHVSKYLSVLMDTKFVERRQSITDSERSRNGRYHITDPYLRFYYRFLANRQSQLALGQQDQALAEIQRHFRDFIGTHTWEELSREWVIRASGRDGGLEPLQDRVGSYWSKTAQVDVVGINPMERSLVLGEAKWSEKAQPARVMEELIAKTSEIQPDDGWNVCWIGFFREGMKAGSPELSKAATRIVDLETLDRDLTEWTS